MAWYTIKFSCGHEERIQLYGKTADRENKIRYYEREGECSECYRKGLERARAKANEEAEKKAEESGLPQLTGSPKQISWATTLRQEFIDYVNENYEPTEEAPEMMKEFMDRMMKEHTTAKYWIENRHGFKSDLFIYREAKEMGLC